MKQGDVVLFIGAGMSMNSRLPGWVDLILPMAKDLNAPWPSDEKDINSEHLLAIANYYENQYGRNELVRFLMKKLETTSVRPSPAHYLLTLLPVQVLFTTNYDNLLEQTYANVDMPAHVIVDRTEIAYWQHRQVQIVKLCGELARPNSLFFTKSDFNIYAEANRPIIEMLRTLFETKTALFLGYGLRDPFINQIWDTIKWGMKSHQRLSYASFLSLNPLEEKDLQSRNICPIILDPAGTQGHEAFLQWLISLALEVTGPLKPEQLDTLLKHVSNSTVRDDIRSKLQAP